MGSTNTTYPILSTDSLWWVYFIMCTQATALSQSSTYSRTVSLFTYLCGCRGQKTLWHAPVTYLCLWMQRPQNAQSYSSTVSLFYLNLWSQRPQNSEAFSETVSLSIYSISVIAETSKLSGNLQGRFSI
jgi:hypothetical protein